MKLLLLSWEGAEWSLLQPLLDAGALPNLARLIEQGTLARLASLAPVLAGPLGATVATGLRPETTGVVANDLSLDERLTPPIWRLAAQHGRRTIVVGWPFPPQPPVEEGGVFVSGNWAHPAGPCDQPWPVPADAVFPVRLRDDLAELRVHPGEFEAGDLAPFVPDLAAVDLRAEPLPLVLAHHLAATVSVHCAATYLLENEPWDFAAAHFVGPGTVTREFLDLAPPRLPQVPEQLFARYQGVIAETLKFHDRLLARLLELAGPDAVVLLCSASGWIPIAQRPALARGEHAENVARERAQGWAVLRAPGVKPDELLYGGSLLDLAPTMAWLLGLPVPAGWPGREWVHAFVAAPPLTRQHSAGSRGVPDAPVPIGDDETARERRYLLARYLLHAGRVTDAVPLLLALHAAWPHRIGPALHVIPALAALGRTNEARGLLDDIAARPEGGLLPRAGRQAKFPPQFDFMRGVIALAEGNLPSALTHFERTLAAGAPSAELHVNLGRVYLGLRRAADARAAFGQALALEPDSPEAHYGAGLAAYRLRDSAPADHALDSAARRTEPVETHLLLGLALARIGPRAQAIEALHHALARRPGLLLAHRALIALHRREPAEAMQADAHRAAARAIFLRRARSA